MNTAPQQLPFQPASEQQGTRPNFDLNSAFLYSSLLDSQPTFPQKQEVPFKETVMNVKKCPHNELYKTELCRFWRAKMPCKFGSGCWFAHGPEELQIAQFVVPAKNPSFSSLDYEVRNKSFGPTASSAFREMPEMQMFAGLAAMDEMRSLSLDNDHLISDFLPRASFGNSINELAAGSNFCIPKDSYPKAVGCERKARKADRGAKLNDIGFDVKAFGPWGPWAADFGDSGIASSRRSSDISSATCSDKEIHSPTFNAGPKSVFQSPSSTGSSDSDRQNTALKDNLCDMYQWCGQCFMGSSCPYNHPY